MIDRSWLRRGSRGEMAMPPTPPSRKSRRARPAAPEEFRLERHLFYLLSRVLASRNRALNAKLARHGLDYPRWRVLAVLNEHPDASMLQLAELTSVDRTSLTHTVRLLVEEGLVERSQRGSDRRSVALALTRSGMARFRRILPDVLAQNTMALSGLADREIEVLRAGLKRVLDNLER